MCAEGALVLILPVRLLLLVVGKTSKLRVLVFPLARAVLRRSSSCCRCLQKLLIASKVSLSRALHT